MSSLFDDAKPAFLNPKLAVLHRWDKMQNEMRKVLNLWCECESLGYEVPSKDYPFPDSFDDVLQDCCQYQEQLEKWAMKGKK